MMPMMHSPIQFHAHIAVALNLIALVSGTLLLNKAYSEGFFCHKTGKTLGGLVVVVSLLSLLCIGYLSLKKCCHQGDTGTGMGSGMSLGGMGMGMGAAEMPKGWHHPPIDNMPALPEEPTPENKTAPKKK